MKMAAHLHLVSRLRISGAMPRSVHTVKENAEALVVATKEIGLEVNADKTKYMIMSRDQNAGRSHSIRLIIVPLKRWRSSNIWEQR